MVARTANNHFLLTFIAGLSAGATLTLIGLYVTQDSVRHGLVAFYSRFDDGGGDWLRLRQQPSPSLASQSPGAPQSGGSARTPIDIRKYLAANRTKAEAHLGEDELAHEIFKKIRILCWVMTQPVHHKTLTKTVKATWGKRCNVFYFVSTTEVDNETTAIFHGNESRNILWGKTKVGFKYAYDNHFDDADWFVKADDDTYLIMENMRLLLLDKDPATPVYYGSKFDMIVKQGYMSGGAGYVLSKEALRRFVEESLPDPNKCRQDDAGAEDVQIGVCLMNVGVEAGDSRDQEGIPRFFPFIPQDHVLPGEVKFPLWYQKHIYYRHEQGIECCSDSVVGFHYIDEKLMWAMEYLIYHVHPFGVAPQLTGSTIKEDVIDYLNKLNLTIITKSANGTGTSDASSTTQTTISETTQ